MTIPNPYADSAPQQASAPEAAVSSYGQHPASRQASFTQHTVLVMPKRLRVARVLLFVIAGFSVLAGLVVGGMASSFQDRAAAAGLSMGMLYFEAIAAVLLGIGELVLALRFRNGGNKVRITTLVWGVLAALGGLSQLPQGVIDIGLGGVIAAAMLHPESKAWFQRPRTEQNI